MYAELSQKLGRPATDEEVSEAMGEDLDGFYALIDQLHGLTIGSFENLTVTLTLIVTHAYPHDLNRVTIESEFQTGLT